QDAGLSPGLLVGEGREPLGERAARVVIVLVLHARPRAPPSRSGRLLASREIQPRRDPARVGPRPGVRLLAPATLRLPRYGGLSVGAAVSLHTTFVHAQRGLGQGVEKRSVVRDED